MNHLQSSISLDPFMYLTLPIPINKTSSLQIHFVPWDPSKDRVLVSFLLLSCSTSFPDCIKKVSVELAHDCYTPSLRAKIADIFECQESHVRQTYFSHFSLEIYIHSTCSFLFQKYMRDDGIKRIGITMPLLKSNQTTR